MKKLHKITILIAAFSVLLGLKIYYLTQKEGFHADEVWSLTISYYKYHLFEELYETHNEYTGKEFKEIMLTNSNSIIHDIYRLWEDNKDSPHTNLYYSLLRISLIGLKSAEIKDIIFRGGILNLIFFTISFIFFYLITKHFSRNLFLFKLQLQLLHFCRQR